MRKLLRFKFLNILLLIIILSSFCIFPKPCLAWSAVENNMQIINFLRSLWAQLWGDYAGNNQDLGSHQLLSRLSYAYLAEDPAYKEQKDFFPVIDDILGWEGVVVDNAAEAVIYGGKWRNPKRGGPDAADKTPDSEHYYNPLTPAGNAPTAVEKHFSDLLFQLYNQGNFTNKTKPNDSTNHHASWSAHYLADIFVPYHVVGIPAGYLKSKLTTEESGPPYLWMPGKARLNEDETDIEPNSMVSLDDFWGADGDFSAAVGYYKYIRGNKIILIDDKEVVLKDWFDPWYYYKGARVLGSNLEIGTAVHASWEVWAHKLITRSKRAKSPAAYSKNWENASPGFDKPQQIIQNQAAKAKAFTQAQALDTQKYTGIYLKRPELAFNKAIQAVATLWRASISALRPQIKVEPIEPKGSNRYRVVGSVRNVAVEVPSEVKAKLTVEGGKIIDKGGKPDEPKPVTLEKEISWEIETANITQCKIEMQVIGNYKNTPDLGYAVVAPSTQVTVPVTVDKPVEWKHKICTVNIRLLFDGTYRESTGRTGVVVGGGLPEVTFEGSFIGNTFRGKVKPRDGFSETGEIEVTFEPAELVPAGQRYKVSNYSVKYKVEKGGKDASTAECYLIGQQATKHSFLYGAGSSSINISVATCSDICGFIKAKIVQVHTDQKVTHIFDKPHCDKYSSIGSCVDFYFPKVRE